VRVHKATGLEVVTAVKVIPPYSLEVTFDDGVVKVVEFDPHVRGKAFEPLRDPAVFAQARIEGGTVAWPNGADIAPEFLYEAGEQIAP
jgi:hypothetical protein